MLHFNRFVHVLVAKLPFGGRAADVDFDVPSPENYSTTIALNTPYIAAQFDYYSLPDTFIIGDSKMHGGYLNGPLQRGYVYASAVRSYTIRDHEQVILKLIFFTLFPKPCGDVQILFSVGSSTRRVRRRKQVTNFLVCS